MSEPIKLRMAPRESAQEIAARVEREQRRVDAAREEALATSLAPFRVGSVPFLNAVPLTRGLEEQIQFLPPSELARRLQRKELDAALVSITEPLLNPGYWILDGVAVASLGEVKSVFLAHRGSIEQITEVHCDTASLTSVNLLRVLLAERGLAPRFVPLDPSVSPEKAPDALLLIGDRAIEFLRGKPQHQIWDLGAAWLELTKLPFVYAVWAIRKDVPGVERLARELREAKAFGLDTLDF
ncbi:MAG TPA: menaquinone biosynthesis protein, partial [Methylomirabilota bacterium]|nr:menaquinone biosynthesis protein [Methylomirabilota bacterium]